MKTHLFSSLLAFLFMIVQCLIRGSQTCSKLEFNVPDRVIAVEGTLVNVTFYLDTRQCPPNQTSYSIILSRDNNGWHDDVCKLLHAKKCTTTSSSVGCSCLSFGGPMLFSKNVTKADDNSVYVWKWGDVVPGEKEKRITFQIVNDTKTTTSKQVPRAVKASSDAGTTTGEVKALESKSEFALINHSKVVVIISATFCVCLAVISVAVATGVVCYKRARTLHYRPETHTDMNTSFAYLNYALEGVNSSRHQARDIYEEIPDPPKKNRRSRVDSTASSKLGVKLHPFPVEDATSQSPMKEAQVSGDFDGYLHPALISDATPLETREFRDSPTVQSS